MGRISPSTFSRKALSILLNPAAAVFGMVSAEPSRRNPADAAWRSARALDLIWPHITTMFALVAVCFGISYIIFMRAEIRA